jgi:hypothetical protein
MGLKAGFFSGVAPAGARLCLVSNKKYPPPLARGSTIVPIKSKKRSLIFRCTQYRHFAVGNASYNEVSGPSAGSGSSSSEVGTVPPGARL